jgi:hypothetical protein|tara:strand:- start:39 stop:488 length:450 start_codon:yes stop_codon:yes gene_type:complete
MSEINSSFSADLILSVEDHDMRLEDTDENLTAREQEDAANELVRDANQMEREDVRCGACGAKGKETFNTLEFKCAVQACKAVTPMPPAPPVVDRDPPAQELGGLRGPFLLWRLHGEEANRSILRMGGAYHAQWRAVVSDLDAARQPEEV